MKHYDFDKLVERLLALAKRLRAESLHIFPANQRDGHAYHSTAYLLDKAADRLERIADGLAIPSEPTEEMIEAGREAVRLNYSCDKPDDFYTAIYKAMIERISNG